MKTSDYVSTVKALISDKEGIPRSEQRILFAGLQLGSGRLKMFGVKHESSLLVSMRLDGGAKKVLKSIVKSRMNEKTIDRDQAVFEAAFNTAVSVHLSSSYNVQGAITKFNVDQLEMLKVYLTKDKTNSAGKMVKLAEFMPTYMDMQRVVEKLMIAMSEFRKLVIDDLEEHFADTDGNVQMALLAELVSNVLYAKKTTADAAAAAVVVMAD